MCPRVDVSAQINSTLTRLSPSGTQHHLGRDVPPGRDAPRGSVLLEVSELSSPSLVHR
jgi:hypothetical protein